MRRTRLALCAALLAVPLLAAPTPWIEVKSPHFTVVTNDSEKQARRTAWQFEQIRAAAGLRAGNQEACRLIRPLPR